MQRIREHSPPSHQRGNPTDSLLSLLIRDFSSFSSGNRSYEYFRRDVLKHIGDTPEEVIKATWDKRLEDENRKNPFFEVDPWLKDAFNQFSDWSSGWARPGFRWLTGNSMRAVLILGCILMTAALLFPPFQYELPLYRGGTREHAGFFFLFSPPHGPLTVNVGLLSLELVVFGFVTAAICVLIRSK